MKLSKTFGRVATTLVATAMLASVAVVPAFAEDFNGFTGGTSDKPIAASDIIIKKELYLPTGSVTPTQTFNFDIKPATANPSETIPVQDGGTVGVRNGIGSNLTNAGSVTISPEDDVNRTTTGKYDTVWDNITFTQLPSGFTDAGVYKYEIVEQDLDPADEDFNDATAQLYLYLVVERKNGVEVGNTTADNYFISGATVYNATAKTDKYTNWYKLGSGEQPDPDAQVGTVTVSKTVAGAMGSKNDEFTFTITSLDGADVTDAKISIDGGAATAVSENGQFTLTHGQTATITGLDAGDYTIAETVDRGYQLTDVTGGTKNGNGVSVEVTGGYITEVGFTNTRNAVSPTGIVMNVAPYALLVVVAAGACFFFVRKRRED